MFKLLKFIFKLLLLLLLITIIGTIVIGFVAYDYSGPKFDNQHLDNYPTMEEETTKSLITSFKKIKANNYDDEHNLVTISYKGDDELGFKSINREIVEHVELTNGYIYDGGAIKIRNVLVCPHHDNDYNIALRLDIEAIGFYKAAVKLYGKAKYQDGDIIATFDKYNVGVLPVFKFIVDALPLDKIITGDIFNIYKDKTGIICTIDLDYLLINRALKGANSVILAVLGLNKTVEFNEKSLDIKINTKSTFSPLNPVPVLI